MAWMTRKQVRSQPVQSYSERQLQKLLEAYDKAMGRLNDQYLRMMGEHIRDIGTMWPSDVHRLQQIRRMNKNLRQLQRRIGVAAGRTESEIERIFEEIAKEDIRMQQKILGVPDVLRIENNKPLQRILQAQARETAERMRNLSNTTVVSKYYRDAVDEAVTAVQSGVEDYNTAIRRVIREAGEHGMRVTEEGTRKVDYESGWSRRLDTAARMNVLDGVRHLNQSIMEEVSRQFGANGVEIDAHMLCAEDHLPYQGGQYSNEEFEEIQDSLQRPFGEWNCRHSWHGIIMGVSPPTWTPDQLEQMQRYSTERITIDSRTKTRYQWSQEMRRVETAVRQQKDTATLARATGDDKLRLRCQGTILQLNQKYEALANKAGLQPEFQRTYVAGFRDVKIENPDSGQAVAASRRYVDKRDSLYRLLEFVKPIDGYEDFGGHGKPYYLEIDTNLGVTEKYNAKQFADMLREDPSYHGGDIRLLVCNSGEKDDGFACQLAKYLHVSVVAPSEMLWVGSEESARGAGSLFVSDIDSLAYLWYNGIDVKESGIWRKFKPDGTWEKFELGR